MLDFVKAVGGKLLVSVANCEGIHSAHEPWRPDQAKLLFDLSRDYGVPIDAAEFMNEPNMLAYSGAPEGYTFDHYIRDQDIFNRWLHENYPGTLAVGPCSVGGGQMGKMKMEEGLLKIVGKKMGTEKLLIGAQEKMEVFSYHYYNGVSERMAAMMPSAFTPFEGCMGEDYLGAAAHTGRCFSSYRDKYCPGGDMWVTESGDAGAHRGCRLRRGSSYGSRRRRSP